jgi:hypothetical protein
MTRRDLVRHATSGTLRLYDNECSIQWDNLPAEERADWHEMFDLFRDNPSPYTEEVIQAIQMGLRPQKVVVTSHHSPWGPPPEKGERVWLFRAGVAFSPPCQVPELLLEPDHLLEARHAGQGLRQCLPAHGHRWMYSDRFARKAVKVRLFRHVAHAWAYLLSFL